MIPEWIWGEVFSAKADSPRSFKYTLSARVINVKGFFRTNFSSDLVPLQGAKEASCCFRVGADFPVVFISSAKPKRFSGFKYDLFLGMANILCGGRWIIKSKGQK